jgi:hypothetical protein
MLDLEYDSRCRMRGEGTVIQSHNVDTEADQCTEQ